MILNRDTMRCPWPRGSLPIIRPLLNPRNRRSNRPLQYPRFSCSSRNNTFPWTQPCFSWTDLESTREFPPSSCVARGDSESTLRARSRCLNRGRPSRCVRIRARTTVPINLVMGEKLPRLRLKTHPATAIFSQHLRITRNCRSFVPFLPSLCRRSVPGNPRAVHCLTPRAPCRERRNEMRKGEERERERA